MVGLFDRPCRVTTHHRAWRNIAGDHGTRTHQGARADGQTREYRGTGPDERVLTHPHATAQGGAWSHGHTGLQNAFVVHIGTVVDDAHVSQVSLGCHDSARQNLHAASQPRLRTDAGIGVYEYRHRHAVGFKEPLHPLPVASLAPNGGHPVPEDKIISRYHRSLELLPAAVEQSSRAYVFDNSNHARTWIADITDGDDIELQTDQMPNWFRSALWDQFAGAADA